MSIFARAATKLFDQGAGTLAAGAHVLQMGGGRSTSGISVTTDRAMRYSAFWDAVRILSEDVAKVPYGVFVRTSTTSTDDASVERQGSKPDPSHAVDRVIRYQANPELTAYHWREVTMAHALTWGNGYSLKVRDGLGRLRGLYLLATDRMDVDRVDRESQGTTLTLAGELVPITFAAGDLRYRYTRTNGQMVDFSRAQILHIPGLSWDGVKGYSVIRLARETIGLGLAAEEHGSRFFGQGATTSFVLSTDNKLSEQAWEHLEDQIQDEHTGLSNAWKPWVLEEGLKPQTLSMPNDDAQWLETRTHQIRDIARWFRLSPHKLGDLERATFSNIEHLSLEHVGDALMGWFVRFESAMAMQLLGPDWLGAGGKHYLKFNVNALQRGDFETRMKGYATGRQWGFLSANDIRELEDMNPIPGGDEYLVPLNMTTVNPDGSITQTTMTSRNGKEPAGATA